MAVVVVSESFDDIRSRQVRFLDEAAKLGDLHVLLWSDAMVQAITRKPPKFPEAERLYFVQSMRYVKQAVIVPGTFAAHSLPNVPGIRPDLWVTDPAGDAADRRRFCERNGVEYRVIGDAQLVGFPAIPAPKSTGQKKVIVTGCYDWFHTGHVRFFEEVSEHGELYVVVGHDANIALLKGAGHPQFPQDERRYMVQAVRFVHQALISTGHGWVDAEPEIKRIKPEIYAVNEDGDKPEKREYCRQHGLEYLVLKRLPKPGLPKRQSTDLRGF